MGAGYCLYRDQIVDEAVGVGNKAAWTYFDVQSDCALIENVLEKRKSEIIETMKKVKSLRTSCLSLLNFELALICPALSGSAVS